VEFVFAGEMGRAESNSFESAERELFGTESGIFAPARAPRSVGVFAVARVVARLGGAYCAAMSGVPFVDSSGGWTPVRAVFAGLGRCPGAMGMPTLLYATGGLGPVEVFAIDLCGACPDYSVVVVAGARRRGSLAAVLAGFGEQAAQNEAGVRYALANPLSNDEFVAVPMVRGILSGQTSGGDTSLAGWWRC
jgi:hypothetical protein